MSFDGVIFKKVINKLDLLLTNGDINSISQVSDTSFIFNVFNHAKINRFIINISNNSSYLSILETEPNSRINSNFYQILRKNLSGGKIESIKQINNDRIALISISNINLVGSLLKYNLYLELTGKLTNIILTNEENIIIDALHKYINYDERVILPKSPYIFPLLRNADEEFYNFSKNLKKEFEYRINNGENIDNLLSLLEKSQSIYVSEKDYHLIPLTSLNTDFQEFDIFEGINKFYENKNNSKSNNEELNNIIKTINQQIKHLKNKILKLQEELNNSTDSLKFKEYGDLIFTYVDYKDLNSNKDVIILEGTKIILDPKISIKDNANKFYKKYSKYNKSIPLIQEQIEISKINIDYLENLLIQLSDSPLEQIKQELIENKIIKSQKLSVTKKNQKSTLKLDTFTCDGIKISIGKNNLQNEYLTFNLAKYNEYFFHVKDYAGSHVIVHSLVLNEKIIRYAANLAAYYSKARYSSSVPVNYTLVKYVKKHPSNKKGLVLLKEYKTIYIDPIKV